MGRLWAAGGGRLVAPSGRTCPAVTLTGCRTRSCLGHKQAALGSAPGPRSCRCRAGAARERAWRGRAGPGQKRAGVFPLVRAVCFHPSTASCQLESFLTASFQEAGPTPRPFLIPQGSLSARSSLRLVWKALKPVKINGASNKFTNAQRLRGVPSGRQGERRPALPGEAGWFSQNPSGGRPEQFGATR